MKIKIKILSEYNNWLKNALIEIVNVEVGKDGNVKETVLTSIGTTIAGNFEVGKTYIADLVEQTEENNGEKED